MNIPKDNATLLRYCAAQAEREKQQLPAESLETWWASRLATQASSVVTLMRYSNEFNCWLDPMKFLGVTEEEAGRMADERLKAWERQRKAQITKDGSFLSEEQQRARLLEQIAKANDPGSKSPRTSLTEEQQREILLRKIKRNL